MGTKQASWNKKLLFLLLMVCLTGMQSLPPQEEKNNTSIQIFYSGNIIGYLESCGCGGKQDGGLAKWATFIKKNTQSSPINLILDSGYFISNQQDIKELKTEYVVKAMSEIGYDAINLSERDISQIGKNPLISLKQKYNLPFVSSNIFCLESMKLLTTPYIIKSFRQSNNKEIKIGIFGLARQINLEKEGLIIKNPTTVAKEVVEELRNKCEFIIALTQLTKEDSLLLAKDVHGIDIIICSGKFSFTDEERLTKVDQGIIAQPDSKKTKATSFKLYLNDEGKISSFEEKYAPLDDKIPFDEKIVKIIDEYKGKIKDKESSEPKTRVVQKIYVGTNECGQCHQKQYKKWQKSRHSKAFYSLKKAKEEKNPACLKCHTTGYRQDNGFWDTETTPDFINVGCEECHRLRIGHVMLHKTPLIDEKTIITADKPGKVNSSGICMKCHTVDKDTKFDFEKDKKKIVH
ncbi:MAG: multiheme c-type cytochrome [Nitrospirota bacterium]